MINNKMELYNYFSFTLDEYGQEAQNPEPQGQIKIAIYPYSQTVVNNIKYSQATYIGLTKDLITDKNFIDYNGIKLKVLYVQPGRYTQVFLGEI